MAETRAITLLPDLPRPPLALPSPVLTDEEADAIRRKLAEGWRGPVLLTWLEQLLQDREERRESERQREREGDRSLANLPEGTTGADDPLHPRKPSHRRSTQPSADRTLPPHASRLHRHR
jgi:hypothetical protein